MRFMCFSAAVLTFLLEKDAEAVNINDYDASALAQSKAKAKSWDDEFHAQLSAMTPGDELSEAQLDTAHNYLAEYPIHPEIMSQTHTLADAEKGSGKKAKQAKQASKNEAK